jgi:hypothetical protein
MDRRTKSWYPSIVQTGKRREFYPPHCDLFDLRLTAAKTLLLIHIASVPPNRETELA